jgi:hypothetical protein
MFFVAFNKRQKKIVEIVEEIEKGPDMSGVIETEENANHWNVINLDEELDLE